MIQLIDEIMQCFATAIAEVNSSTTQVNPPLTQEDDEAELEPINPVSNQFDYLNGLNYDEIPF